MKNILPKQYHYSFIVLLLLSTHLSYAQFNRSDIIIESNIGISVATVDVADEVFPVSRYLADPTSRLQGTKMIVFRWHNSIAYQLTKNWQLGLGGNFKKQKIIDPFQREEEEETLIEKVFASSLHLQYTKSIHKKIMTGIRLSTSYAWAKKYYNFSRITSIIPYGFSSILPDHKNRTDRSSEPRYISLALQPNLQYFITKHLGLQVAFHGFQLRHTFPDKWEELKAGTALSLDFAANNWTLGWFVYF